MIVLLPSWAAIEHLGHIFFLIMVFQPLNGGIQKRLRVARILIRKSRFLLQIGVSHGLVYCGGFCNVFKTLSWF